MGQQLSASWGPHGLSHGHTHDHFSEKQSTFNLISLGISGGIAPSYDAIVVLLIAFSLNQIGMGIALISIFSLGLASVLIALAIMFSKSKFLLDKFSDTNPFIRHIPSISAIAIIIMGSILTIRSLLPLM